MRRTTMASAEHSAVQQENRVQTDIRDAATRLRDLLGVKKSADEVVAAVRDI
jgi:hypothetical protein